MSSHIESPHKNPVLLEMKDLTTVFHSDQESITACEDINITLYENEIFALVGESGSGKSVTAKSILGLLPYPSAQHPRGEIHYYSQAFDKGLELVKASEKQMQSIRGNEISIIFQEPLSALNPLQNIEKQLSEIIHQHQKHFSSANNKSVRQYCLELLAQVQLDDRQRILDDYPHNLSGGQRQRILIAMAIANRPRLLIADEPTTALDVTVQKEILDLLVSLKDQLNMSILLITHDLGVVKHYAQRVAVMHSGKILEQQDCDSLFKRPSSSYTRELIDASQLNTSIVEEKAVSEQTLLELESFSVYIAQKKGFFKKAKKKYLVKDLSLTLKQGATLGLVGESGSGKTSTAMGLLGLFDIEGSAIFNQHNLKQLDTQQWQVLRKDLQIVFQDPFSSLSPRMNVEQIICEGLNIHGQLSSDERQQAVFDILQDVGLDKNILNRYPHEFSGGQRQRIAIARVLILKPNLVILDEPTSALDKPIQAQIINLLESLQKKYQLSYIFISHDLNLVRHICDHVVVLQNGRMVESADKDSLFKTPQKSYTKNLIDAILL